MLAPREQDRNYEWGHIFGLENNLIWWKIVFRSDSIIAIKKMTSFVRQCNNKTLIVLSKKKSAFVNELGQTRTKGHLISEKNSVLNFPKMQWYIARISALASKIGQIKKLKAHYHPN